MSSRRRKLSSSTENNFADLLQQQSKRKRTQRFLLLSRKIGSTRFHFQEAINWILINRYIFPFDIEAASIEKNKPLSIHRKERAREMEIMKSEKENCIILCLIESLNV